MRTAAEAIEVKYASILIPSKIERRKAPFLLFSNTFDRLQTDTDRIWKFQRYSLVCEYLSRPSLPPPFIFFSHLWRFALYTLARCNKAKWVQDTYFQHSNRTKYSNVSSTDRWVFLRVKTNLNIFRLLQRFPWTRK